MLIKELPGGFYLRGKQLLIYRDFLQDELYCSFLELLNQLSGTNPQIEALASAYGKFFSLLAEKSELYEDEIIGTAWENYLMDKILEADNVFSRKAAKKQSNNMGCSLIKAVREDLNTLQTFASLENKVCEEAKTRLGLNGCRKFPPWDAFRPLNGTINTSRQAGLKKQFKKAMLNSPWEEQINSLADYYARCGSGIFGQFWAFRWAGNESRLIGISEPDPIRLEDLIGYEKERSAIIQNTEKFLKGLPACNVLLYGARGTGKSSTVKGLLNAYGSQGLRLIELPKRFFSDYQKVLQIISIQPQKFIIFLDDFSFEEEELEYKELKGLLEGSLQVKPENVLVYATSNRRHLVKEFFADRERGQSEDQEVRQADTLQEKLSLAERFGLTLIYCSPNQEEYLTIVKGLAEHQDLAIDEDQLRDKALRWALYQNGLSGRTARQFIDHLLGELKNCQVK